MSLVASVPKELVDRGRIDGVVLVVHSDKVLVVVLIDSTEDSRYDSLRGPLSLKTSSSGPSLLSTAPFLTWLVVFSAPRPFCVVVVVVGLVVGLLLEA